MTKKAKPKAKFAERRKKASPAEAVVYICLDMGLHRRYIDATIRLEQLKTDTAESTTMDDVPAGDIETLAQEIVDLRDQIEAASEPYVFRKLRNPDWRALGDDHPPTEEQLTAADKRLQGAAETLRVVLGDKAADAVMAQRPNVNGDTFWPEAVAACAVDPELTVDDAVWLRDGDGEWPGLPDDKWAEIINTVTALHTSGVDVPKEWLGTAQILKQGLNSITAALEESPSASSEDA